MARPPVDLARKIKDILKHVQPLPDEAKAPILHYRRTVADIWGALGYVERAIGQGGRYQIVVDRHLGRVYAMALVNLVETFERFLKEVAGECVDGVKLRLWAKEAVVAPRLLTPTRNDLNYLKRFLDETANDCNQRIGDRLAQLLTSILPTAPIWVTPQAMANRVTAIFRRVLEVA